MLEPQSFGFGSRVGDLFLGEPNISPVEYRQLYQQYVYGIFNRVIIPAAHARFRGSRPNVFSRNLLIRSPSPCHVTLSIKAYDSLFVMPLPKPEPRILARGCGNASVGEYGILLLVNKS
jgi:hypothetical protein